MSEKSKENNMTPEDNDASEETDESTPAAISRLSLNAKAIPYFPKQDGSSLATGDTDTAREQGEDGSVVEAYEGKESSTTTNNKEHVNGQQHDLPNEDLQREVTSLKQSLRHYEEMIDQYQASEQTRKREVDSALISAREVVERERREKMDVLSDRKSRQEQFEQLSKTLEILQGENDELQKLRRQQDEKLAELTRLKTLIQENGFPNVDQFLMLQKQIESFRDDFFNERKERERLQSQKDKIKRDLEAAQSRIASLQEQVYKYREHIYYIQNELKPSSPFRPLPFFESRNTRSSVTAAANEACKLYGPNATQYINHGLASGISPVSGTPGSGPESPKFPVSRGEKKGFPSRYSDGGQGRQWQDSRVPRPVSGSEDWKRAQQQQQQQQQPQTPPPPPQQQSGRNGYFNNNINRLTSSQSAPSLSPMIAGEHPSPSDHGPFYEKQFGKPGFPRRPRSSLADDTNKEFGMPHGDWSKQVPCKQGKRFPSPLPSPNLLANPGPELWSPQQGSGGLGFQKGWQNAQDEIFRFPPSPLTTPTSKTSFDTWPKPATALTPDDHGVFPPPTSVSDDHNFLPLSMGQPGRKDGGFGRFSQSHATNNGLVYVCYNCGINFEDNDAHRNHVETCGM